MIVIGVVTLVTWVKHVKTIARKHENSLAIVFD